VEREGECSRSVGLLKEDRSSARCAATRRERDLRTILGRLQGSGWRCALYKWERSEESSERLRVGGWVVTSFQETKMGEGILRNSLNRWRKERKQKSESGAGRAEAAG
jgi:hypothetical protein